MKCDVCNIADAVIHIKQIVGDSENELHLCEECAEIKGIIANDDKVEFSVSNLLTGLVDISGLSKELDKKKVCPKCKLTMEKLKKQMKLGCSECYSVFSKEIQQILRKIFDDCRHKGKYPKYLLEYKNYLMDIQKLKLKLQEVLQEENYEEAAKIRDKINELKIFSGKINA